MMKTFSIYRTSDGHFTGTIYTVPEEDIGINTPAGHACIEGEHDHLSSRVDVVKLKKDEDEARADHVEQVTQLRLRHSQLVDGLRSDDDGSSQVDPGEFVEPSFIFYATAKHVVGYQPAQPSPDHEWIPDTRRWRLTAAAQKALDNSVQARALLSELDLKSIRRLREILAASDPQLNELEQQAASLRPQVIKR